jgi:hypothetical protein
MTALIGFAPCFPNTRGGIIKARQEFSDENRSMIDHASSVLHSAYFGATFGGMSFLDFDRGVIKTWMPPHLELLNSYLNSC